MPTTTPAVVPQAPASQLRLTPNAADKVRHFRSQDEKLGDKGLRVYIEGGGCSGYKYGFAFDDAQGDDLIFEHDGLKMVIDPISYERLKGSVVDYVDDFRGAGFIVQNPNAKSTCGCGSSFSV
ncbi:MAG: iron-sulfur cluster insertion protein ErpA [Planctomycetes bacterium]|nr:iron-sulfur cluster insertion protein ErpA [Planctomycetota bacterium]